MFRKVIYKTKAISLHTVKYGDSSLIAYIYTQEHGRITLMVHGAYGRKKTSAKAVLFQPLSILNIVYYHKGTQAFSTLKEVTLDVTFNSIPYDPVKRAIALFVGEVVYKTIREEEANPVMYSYLEHSIQLLDLMHQGTSNFHLLFLSQLSRHLGFYPGNSWSDTLPFFDYKNGLFVSLEPTHPLYFSKERSKMLGLLFSTPFHDADNLQFNHKLRSQLIDNILSFYHIHIESVTGIKSLPILSQVFEE